jgi:hypothetical protein
VPINRLNGTGFTGSQGRQNGVTAVTALEADIGETDLVIIGSEGTQEGHL